MKIILLLVASLLGSELGCAKNHADQLLASRKPSKQVRIGVASAYRVNNVVTLTFFGTAHNLQPGDTFHVENRYGKPNEDRRNFPPGKKTVTSVPHSDTLTYGEAGPDANLSGSMSILVKSN